MELPLIQDNSDEIRRLFLKSLSARELVSVSRTCWDFHDLCQDIALERLRHLSPDHANSKNPLLTLCEILRKNQLFPWARELREATPASWCDREYLSDRLRSHHFREGKLLLATPNSLEMWDLVEKKCTACFDIDDYPSRWAWTTIKGEDRVAAITDTHLYTQRERIEVEEELRDVIFDAEGDLLLATDKRIARFHKGKLTTLIDRAGARVVRQLSNGHLVVGSDEGLSLFPSEGTGTIKTNSPIVDIATFGTTFATLSLDGKVSLFEAGNDQPVERWQGYETTIDCPSPLSLFQLNPAEPVIVTFRQTATEYVAHQVGLDGAVSLGEALYGCVAGTKWITGGVHLKLNEPSDDRKGVWRIHPLAVLVAGLALYLIVQNQIHRWNYHNMRASQLAVRPQS